MDSGVSRSRREIKTERKKERAEIEYQKQKEQAQIQFRVDNNYLTCDIPNFRDAFELCNFDDSDILNTVLGFLTQPHLKININALVKKDQYSLLSMKFVLVVPNTLTNQTQLGLSIKELLEKRIMKKVFKDGKPIQKNKYKVLKCDPSMKSVLVQIIHTNKDNYEPLSRTMADCKEKIQVQLSIHSIKMGDFPDFKLGEARTIAVDKFNHSLNCEIAILIQNLVINMI